MAQYSEVESREGQKVHALITRASRRNIIVERNRRISKGIQRSKIIIQREAEELAKQKQKNQPKRSRRISQREAEELAKQKQKNQPNRSRRISQREAEELAKQKQKNQLKRSRRIRQIEIGELKHKKLMYFRKTCLSLTKGLHSKHHGTCFLHIGSTETFYISMNKIQSCSSLIKQQSRQRTVIHINDAGATTTYLNQ